MKNKILAAIMMLTLGACAANVADDPSADEVDLEVTTQALPPESHLPGNCPADPGSFQCMVWDEWVDGGGGGGGGGSGVSKFEKCSNRYEVCESKCTTIGHNACIKKCEDKFEQCMD